MSYPRTYPTGVGSGHCTSADWNAMVARINSYDPSGYIQQPASFIIKTDGTDTYAIAGGQVVYGGPDDAGSVDGADAGAVINAALGALTESRTSKERIICDGTFTLTTQIGIESYTILEGGTFIIDPSVGAVAFALIGFYTNPVTDVDIVGVNFNGNESNMTYESAPLYGEDGGGPLHIGINFGTTTSNISIRHCTFTDFSSAAVWPGIITGPPYNYDVFDHVNLLVEGNLFVNNAYAVVVEATKNFSFISNQIYGALGFDQGSYSWGVSLNYMSLKNILIKDNIFDGKDASKAYAAINMSGNTSVVDAVVEGNIIENWAAMGIRIENAIVKGNVIRGCGYGYSGTGDGCIISQNKIISTQYIAIHYGAAETCSNCQIIDNMIYDSALADDQSGTYGGICGSTTLAMTNVKIRDNIVVQATESKAKYGIYISGTFDNIDARDNTIDGDFTYPLFPQSYQAGLITRGNFGYVSESSGSSTGTGSSQTIAHGLTNTGVPITVTVVPIGSGVTVSNVYADNTNIYVTVTNGADYNWYARV